MSEVAARVRRRKEPPSKTHTTATVLQTADGTYPVSRGPESSPRRRPNLGHCSCGEKRHRSLLRRLAEQEPVPWC
jgi:hypothetical protein